MVFSVGGGNLKKKVSVNLIKAIKYANLKRGKIISVIGRSDGYAYKNSTVSILVNVEDTKLVTPISETFQALLWHFFVSHPYLQVNKTKW
jgi:D-sedoheptulose 7-phosphate isomerase